MTLRLVVVWVNVAMSFTACGTMIAASRHSFPELRPAFAAGGVLAAIYCGAYLWLGFNLERSAEWSTYVRPVSLIAWPVAWIVPASVSMRLWRKLHRILGVPE